MKLLTIPLTRTSLLLGLMAGLLCSVGAQAQTSMGILDLKKVFDGYYRTKQADTQLKERAADFEKLRQGMVKDFETMKADFERLRDAANDQALSADERERRKTDADKKLVEMRQIEQDVAQFDRTSRSTLAEQQRRMRDRILDEIKEVVKLKATQAGLSMVVDVAAESVNQTPVVLYHDGKNDLTDAILGELNSRKPMDLPALEDPAPGTR